MRCFAITDRIVADGRRQSTAWSDAAGCGPRTRSRRWLITSAANSARSRWRDRPPAQREETMRDLVAQYLSQSLSRRGFVGGLSKAGLTAAAAQSVLSAVTSVSYAQGAGPQPGPAAPTVAAEPASPATSGAKPFQGTGGACFAEQLIACGVKYVFGNSASEDAQFYEALVDRPQLKYILT